MDLSVIHQFMGLLVLLNAIHLTAQGRVVDLTVVLPEEFFKFLVLVVSTLTLWVEVMAFVVTWEEWEWFV